MIGLEGKHVKLDNSERVSSADLVKEVGGVRGIMQLWTGCCGSNIRRVSTAADRGVEGLTKWVALLVQRRAAEEIARSRSKGVVRTYLASDILGLQSRDVHHVLKVRRSINEVCIEERAVVFLVEGQKNSNVGRWVTKIS